MPCTTTRHITHSLQVVRVQNKSEEYLQHHEGKALNAHFLIKIYSRYEHVGHVSNMAAAGIGSSQWWGFSPALDLAAVYDGI